MIFRRLLVVAVALFLGAQVVRNAAVVALSTLHPAAATKFWAGHPNAEISLGLTEIGDASRLRTPIETHTFALINDAATKAPLAPEPFLVRGIRAQMQGDDENAKRAFLDAQWRDPRSLPAAYFLANYYLTTGDTFAGLQEISIVARLSAGGGGEGAAVSMLAKYAQDRTNWPKVRALFASQEYLEDGILLGLAQDARNADAILALAGPDHRKPDSAWLPILLGKMVDAGDYGRARAIWSSIGGGHKGSAPVFDPTFSTPGPPPPFNWSFASSTVGLAERQPRGRLHVIFYGNVDGVLASQLLLLQPGNYRVRMQLIDSTVHPELLSWSLRCDKTSEPFATATVHEVASKSWSFVVGAHCPAQWLELSGRSGDIAEQSEVVIGTFRLSGADING